MPKKIQRFLVQSGLVPDGPGEPLTGGVSSEIWRVRTEDGRDICVKRALAKLRVTADWRVSTDRNRYEVRWYREVSAIAPGLAPRILAASDAQGVFAMEFLPPERFSLWKADLMAGRVQPEVFGRVASGIARVHAATAGRPEIVATFASDANFEALRLAPYLRATAQKHPAFAEQLHHLADRTAGTKKALVHGDLSPKNILVGDDGAPVLLDAECAWYGDPAFDPAFCLNHFLLKAMHMPNRAPALLDGFRRFWAAYLAGVDWEAPSALASRTATLLPGLLLARIDGKSPVEYIHDEAARDGVRDVAKTALGLPCDDPVAVASLVEEDLKGI